MYIDRSDIREGELDEVKSATKRLVAFVEENNPHILSYSIFLDDDARRMAVVAVHPDSAALEFHMDVGNEEFRKFGEYLELVSIEVYGEVGDTVRDRLHRKAEMLGDADVSVHDAHAGFVRR